MQPFTNILVDIDATAPTHPALARAVDVARGCGARLTIADVLTIPSDARRYLGAGAEEDLVSRRREQLARIAREITGVPTDSILLMGRPATSLIQCVLRSGHDLLMRSHARDLVARGPRPFGAVDMELLRHCPCPVLIVGPGRPPEQPRILGAVHANVDDEAEQGLNVKIIELTLLLAQLESGVPTLLQAWAPFGEELIRSHATEEAIVEYVEEARRRAAADLAQLTAPFSDRLSAEQIVLRRGDPQDVIPEFALGESVDLVVMGTVARTGIAGLLIGNTAERVLRKLPCSVLAVKPEGFVSPVRADTSS